MIIDLKTSQITKIPFLSIHAAAGANFQLKRLIKEKKNVKLLSHRVLVKDFILFHLHHITKLPIKDKR